MQVLGYRIACNGCELVEQRMSKSARYSLTAFARVHEESTGHVVTVYRYVWQRGKGDWIPFRDVKPDGGS